MRLHLLFLLASLGVMAAPQESGSPLVELPEQIENGTATAADLPPITEGIMGPASETVSSASGSTAAPSGSGVTPSATESEVTVPSTSVNGTKSSPMSSGASSGAAYPKVHLDLAKYVGPAAVIVGAMGAGLAVVF